MFFKELAQNKNTCQCFSKWIKFDRRRNQTDICHIHPQNSTVKFDIPTMKKCRFSAMQQYHRSYAILSFVKVIKALYLSFRFTRHRLMKRTTPMASVNTNIFAPVSVKTGFITTFLAAVADWNQARQTRNALNKLSDHELADIGLSRADIDVVASSQFNI